MEKDLNERLNIYCSSDALPMHMPGHKRNPVLTAAPFACDITEIDGFDDLHDPRGLIRDIEEDAKKIWGALDAFISVNGSTALIESAICALAQKCSANAHRFSGADDLSSPGSFVFSANSHISVWHAAEMADLSPVPAKVTTREGIPFLTGTDVSSLAALLTEDPGIRLVLITTPTYEGVITDTSQIRKILNERGGYLIADCSHGAHLGLHPYFPERPDADIVIMSTHKTLHSPTQTAVMAVYSDLIDTGRIRHFLSIFESSSPSYVLMGGLCKTLSDIRDDKDIFAGWVDGLKKARRLLSSLTHLSLLEADSVDTGTDPSKLVILTNGYISGHQLAKKLRSDHHIEVEASYEHHIIAMTGIGDTESSLLRFCNAIMTIDGELVTKEAKEVTEPSLLSGSPVFRMTIKESMLRDSAPLPYKEAAGKISAEYIFPYPPGVPAVVPGQEITGDIAEYLVNAEKSGTRLRIDPLRANDGTVKVLL